MSSILKGFRLQFFFDENEFFTNKVLTKTYYLSDTFEREDSDDGVEFNRAEG
jgi:hypothetical protein